MRSAISQATYLEALAIHIALSSRPQSRNPYGFLAKASCRLPFLDRLLGWPAKTVYLLETFRIYQGGAGRRGLAPGSAVGGARPRYRAIIAVVLRGSKLHAYRESEG